MKLSRSLVLWTVLLSAPLSWAGDPAPLAPEMREQLEKKITNFHVVDDGLYRGARPLDEGLELLAKAGVHTDINLQGGDSSIPVLGALIDLIFEPGESWGNIRDEREKVYSLKTMIWKHLPLNSMEKVDDDEAKTIREALRVMSTSYFRPVYIHCEHGADRTGLLVALYQVRYHGKSIDAAHQEMVELGHDSVHQIFTGAMDDFFYSEAKKLEAERAAELAK